MLWFADYVFMGVLPVAIVTLAVARKSYDRKRKH